MLICFSAGAGVEKKPRRPGGCGLEDNLVFAVKHFAGTQWAFQFF